MKKTLAIVGVLFLLIVLSNFYRQSSVKEGYTTGMGGDSCGGLSEINSDDMINTLLPGMYPAETQADKLYRALASENMIEVIKKSLDEYEKTPRENQLKTQSDVDNAGFQHMTTLSEVQFIKSLLDSLNARKEERRNGLPSRLKMKEI